MRFRRWMPALCAALLLPAAAAETVRQPAVPLDLRVPAPPAWIMARNGAHALYELHLANYRALPLELLRIEVLDVADGGVIALIEGDDLLQDLGRPGAPESDEPVTFIRGGQHAVLYIELIRTLGAALPAAVKHVLTLRRIAEPGVSASDRQWLLEGDVLPIAPAPKFVLGPPLAGPGWLAANGLGNRANHRRTLFAINGQARISQRYAIDFIQIGANGLVASRDPPDNADFSGYGAELLAVADGTVAAVHDGIPDNTPFGEDMAIELSLETIAGNHLLLDIGGAYVLYAHLQPGSFSIKAGDRVRRGQVLGRLGNSGNSDAPHLHLHLTDRASPLGAEGLPFSFEGFAWRGSVDNLDEWRESRQPWMPTSDQDRSRELPLNGDVIDFPTVTGND